MKNCRLQDPYEDLIQVYQSKKSGGRNTGQIPSDYLALAWNFL